MYSKIKEEISQGYYQQNYPNDGQRFIAWYLRNIHNLDTIQAKDCITDGANDKQIDAVYIDNQASTVYIIQGKFYSKEVVDSEPLREVLASWILIKDLPKLQEAANDKLKVKINELSNAIDDDYDICFELVTTSTLTEAAQKDLAVFQKQLAEDDLLTANLMLIDNTTLQNKYLETLNKFKPYISHKFNLQSGKFIELDLSGTKAVIAAIPLRECIKIPGIKDQTLFRKNVRQSLGGGNKVNKGIAHTLKNDIQNFFFLHNGVTAICSKIDIEENILSVKELNIVNGCQSLTTIYNCSETVKTSNEGYIMFRFYEITDSDKADKISTSTNSQSAVKARDLRSNDKNVLAMKKAYEQCFPDGYFITKRGEVVDSIKYNPKHVINLTDIGKQLIAWHSQRPTIAYSETKIFDKYFSQLFKKDYLPENMQALRDLFEAVSELWTPDNPLGLNESLLAMKAYAPYHHLYAISVIFSEINKMPDGVPNPNTVLKKLNDYSLMSEIVQMAGVCLNMAFETASSEAIDNKKIFSPQNWVKNKGCLSDIKSAIRMQLVTYKLNFKNIYEKYGEALKMRNEDFETRWTAD